jgi:hypothetical protein
METLTRDYDTQNMTTRLMRDDTISTNVSCIKTKKDEFDCDLKRAISGEELVNRLSAKILNLFENESSLSTGS